MAPHADYSAELARAYKRGHPIANPQPGIGSDGLALRPLEVGDVGYISHIHGNFIRIFNVHLEPGVDGQPSWDDLPDEFEPLAKREISLLHDRTPVFKSQSVSVRSINAGASGPFMGGSIAFSTSSERGAILATPDPIQCYDAQHILSYRNYAKAHIESWHEFAVQKLGIDIALEDIILVTGVDRTTSWGTAVFTNAHLDARFGLDVQYAGVGVQLAAQFSWRNTQGALVNSGPTNCYQPSLSGSSSVTLRETKLSPLNTVCDQSLFIRHIRAKRRRWLGLKLMANGQPEDMGDPDDSSDAGNDVSTSGNIEVDSYPEREQYSDCLDPVLDYILEHSDVDIAIAHDEDIQRLSSGYNGVPVIHVEDGFGRLQEPANASTHPQAVPVPAQHMTMTLPGQHPASTDDLLGYHLSTPSSSPNSVLLMHDSPASGPSQYHTTYSAPPDMFVSSPLSTNSGTSSAMLYQPAPAPSDSEPLGYTDSNHLTATVARSPSNAPVGGRGGLDQALASSALPDVGQGQMVPGSSFDQLYHPGHPTPSSASASTSKASKQRRGVSGPASPIDHGRSRTQKKEYAKVFRDNEKHHFEQLRRRLFPTEPNTRRTECLERAVSALDDLEQYKEREVQHEAEIEGLRAELARAKQRTQELEQLVAQRQTDSAPEVPIADASQGHSFQHGWH